MNRKKDREKRSGAKAKDERRKGGGFPCWESLGLLLSGFRGGERPEFARLSARSNRFAIKPHYPIHSSRSKCRGRVSVCPSTPILI